MLTPEQRKAYDQLAELDGAALIVIYGGYDNMPPHLQDQFLAAIKVTNEAELPTRDLIIALAGIPLVKKAP